MKKINVGLIGYGNMAQAISSAMVSGTSKYLLKNCGYKIKVAVSDSDEKKLRNLPVNITAVTDNARLAEACDVIILSVKPQHALEAVKNVDFAGKLVVSIMAGVSLSALKALTGGATEKIIRVMPNLNARVGASYSVYCGDKSLVAEKKFVKALLSTFGEAREINEKEINAAMGVCGSGPAFVFKFINALYENGIANGLDKSLAREMALSTVIGSAYLVESAGSDVNIPELVKSVCSKGGTTIEGVDFLDENGFESIVSGAVDKAVKRADEMSVENEKR